MVDVEDYYEESSQVYHNLEQLDSFLRTYKLSQYFQVFVSEGFDRLLSVKPVFFFFWNYYGYWQHF